MFSISKLNSIADHYFKGYQLSLLNPSYDLNEKQRFLQLLKHCKLSSQNCIYSTQVLLLEVCFETLAAPLICLNFYEVKEKSLQYMKTSTLFNFTVSQYHNFISTYKQDISLQLNIKDIPVDLYQRAFPQLDQLNSDLFITFHKLNSKHPCTKKLYFYHLFQPIKNTSFKVESICKLSNLKETKYSPSIIDDNENSVSTSDTEEYISSCDSSPIISPRESSSIKKEKHSSLFDAYILSSL